MAGAVRVHGRSAFRRRRNCRPSGLGRGDGQRSPAVARKEDDGRRTPATGGHKLWQHQAPTRHRERETPMSTLAEGREAYAERRWPNAVGQYTAADRDTELPAGDLERLATSVILTGGRAEGVDILARAHLKYLADGDYDAAVRCAVWTGMNLILRGETS